jgi:hypothetical protein
LYEGIDGAKEAMAYWRGALESKLENFGIIDIGEIYIL